MEWKHMLLPYIEVIAKTSHYQEYINDIVTEVERARQFCDKEKINVLDVGCGLGYLAQRLTAKSENLHVTAIDSNPTMIEYARRQNEKADFICTAIEEFNPIKKYDVVIAANLLCCVENHSSILNTLYQLLDTKGILIVSSMREDANLEILLEKTKKELRKEPKSAEYLRQIKDHNTGIIQDARKVFSQQEIINCLQYHGFPTLLYAGKTFAGQNFLVTMQKNDVKDIVINIEQEEAAFREAWDLRYFILARQLGLIPVENKKIATPHDVYSKLLTARDAENGNLLGFQNIIMDSEIGFPCEETVDITALRENHSPLCSLAGTYLTPVMKGKRLGAFLIAAAANHMADIGYRGNVMESNPRLADFVKRCGSVEYTKPGVTVEGLPKINLFMDLQINRNVRGEIMDNFYEEFGGGGEGNFLVINEKANGKNRK